MGVSSLPKTVTRQRRGCDLSPGPTAPESSTLTTRLPSHPCPGAAAGGGQMSRNRSHRPADGCMHPAASPWLRIDLWSVQTMPGRRACAGTDRRAAAAVCTARVHGRPSDGAGVPVIICRHVKKQLVSRTATWRCPPPLACSRNSDEQTVSAFERREFRPTLQAYS